MIILLYCVKNIVILQKNCCYFFQNFHIMSKKTVILRNVTGFFLIRTKPVGLQKERKTCNFTEKKIKILKKYILKLNNVLKNVIWL